MQQAHLGLVIVQEARLTMAFTTIQQQTAELIQLYTLGISLQQTSARPIICFIQIGKTASLVSTWAMRDILLWAAHLFRLSQAFMTKVYGLDWLTQLAQIKVLLTWMKKQVN
jgi:hypothetical protein